jgi:hypothetical protein
VDVEESLGWQKASSGNEWQLGNHWTVQEWPGAKITQVCVSLLHHVARVVAPIESESRGYKSLSEGE